MTADQELDADADIARCLEFPLRWLDKQFKHYTVVGAGHRLVHYGERLSALVLIDSAIMREIETLIPFTSAHQPYKIAAIGALCVNPTNKEAVIARNTAQQVLGLNAKC